MAKVETTNSTVHTVKLSPSEVHNALAIAAMRAVTDAGEKMRLSKLSHRHEFTEGGGAIVTLTESK